MSAIATPALRDMLLYLMKSEIRLATVARAEAADEFLRLDQMAQRALTFWLNNKKPGPGGKNIVRQLLDEHFPHPR